MFLVLLLFSVSELLILIHFSKQSNNCSFESVLKASHTSLLLFLLQRNHQIMLKFSFLDLHNI